MQYLWEETLVMKVMGLSPGDGPFLSKSNTFVKFQLAIFFEFHIFAIPEWGFENSLSILHNIEQISSEE